MITAKEAHLQSSVALSKKEKEEINTIIPYIEEAVRDGEFQVNLFIKFQITVDALKELGYKVFSVGFGFYTISW